VYKTFSVIAVLLLTGCAASPQGPFLGRELTWTPDRHRIGQTLRQAAADPAVWGPLLAAALLQLDAADRRLSDRLREDTPLFGSTTTAQQASDDARDATGWLWLGSAVLTPGPGRAGEWLSLKGQVLAQEWIAAKAARGLTSGFKSLSARERPNGLNDRSFPSGHATTASVQAHLACLNLAYTTATPLTDAACRLGQGMAVLSGWARVEAGMHYPSDVLVGWAIGRFFASSVRAWLGDGPADPAVDARVQNGEWELSLRWQF